MFRLHATFLSDAEFLVIFPVLGARGSVLTSVERRIDSTERYESNRRLLSLRFGVSARPHVTMVYPKSAKLRPTTLPAELVACKQRMCWHGRLGRDARSACRTTPQGPLSLARVASSLLVGWGLHTRRGGKNFSAAPFSKRQPTSSGRARRGDPNPFSSRSCESLRPREKETKQASILAAQPAFTM